MFYSRYCLNIEIVIFNLSALTVVFKVMNYLNNMKESTVLPTSMRKSKSLI